MTGSIPDYTYDSKGIYGRMNGQENRLSSVPFVSLGRIEDSQLAQVVHVIILRVIRAVDMERSIRMILEHNNRPILALFHRKLDVWRSCVYFSPDTGQSLKYRVHEITTCRGYCPRSSRS